MDAPTPPRSRSVWADLDALVLEEVDALRAGPDLPIETPGFASEEDFAARAAAYLRGHEQPEAVIGRLRIDLGLSEPPEEAPVCPVPGPDEPAAPAADGAEPAA